jgi:hypothetical protein
MQETASRYKGSCEYIEQAVEDSRQWVVFQVGWLGGELNQVGKAYCVVEHSPLEKR